jgi:hypothetical protein
MTNIKLIIAPNSSKLVRTTDACYAEHTDGKSHTVGVVEFESDT